MSINSTNSSKTSFPTHLTPWLTSQLHLAAKNGDIKTLNTLIKRKNIQVNDQDHYGQTPLHIAIKHGHTKCVERLLTHTDINVNLKDHYGQTPLHIAIEREHTKCVEMLLTHTDIQVNPQDHYGQTPLHLAAKRLRGFNKMRILLKHRRINVNPKDHFGQTPLHIAAECCNIEFIRILLECKDIKLEAKNNLNQTFLCLVEKNKIPNILVLIKEKYNINTIKNKIESLTKKIKLFRNSRNKKKNRRRNKRRKTYSFNKTKISIEKKIENLKKKKSNLEKSIKNLKNNNIHYRDKSKTTNRKNKIDDQKLVDNSTPLHTAIKDLQPEVVQNLLKNKDIDVNAKDNNSWTALHWAIITLCQDQGENLVKQALVIIQVLRIIQALLQHSKIKVNTRDKDGRTALHWAVKTLDKSETSIIETLLQHPKIKVNARDKDGETPLHLAAMWNNQYAIKLLRKQKNINLKIKNNQGKTYSSLNKKIRVVKPLSSLFTTLKLRHQILKFRSLADLLERKGPYYITFLINTTLQKARTLLHLAAKYGNIEVIATFLKRKIDRKAINVKDKNQRTPLHLASKYGHKKFVQFLLKHEAIDVKAKNKDGQTPLQLAKKNNHTEVVKALKNRIDELEKSRTNTKNLDNTALHIAAKHGKTENIKELLNKKKITVNAVNKYGQTPLHIAAKNGHAKFIEMLLVHKDINVNCKDYKQKTPLRLAIENQKTKVVQLLLKHKKININAIDSHYYKNTALHIAIKSTYYEGIALLLAHEDIDITATDKDNKTPLCLAKEKEQSPSDILTFLQIKTRFIQILNSAKNPSNNIQLQKKLAHKLIPSLSRLKKSHYIRILLNNILTKTPENLKNEFFFAEILKISKNHKFLEIGKKIFFEAKKQSALNPLVIYFIFIEFLWEMNQKKAAIPARAFFRCK